MSTSRQAAIPAIETSPGIWGMWLLVLTEAALFGALLLSYIYERSNADIWPPAGVEPPKLLLPLIMTVLLLGSSVTMLGAERAIRTGRVNRMKLALAASVALAAGFLGLQAYEYSRETMSLGDSVYSSLFFTITGLHGLHVAIAVLMGAWLVLRAVLGHFSRDRHLAIRVVSLYWHFVDVVWIAILGVLYFLPHVW